MTGNIKKTMSALAVMAFITTQASATTFENKTNKDQQVFIAKDKGKLNQFLSSLQVLKVITPVIETAAVDTYNSALDENGESASKKAKKTSLKITKKVAPGLSKSIAQEIDAGLPQVGDIIAAPKGVEGRALSKIGEKLSGSILNVRWGNTVRAGQKLEWNPGDLVGKSSGFLGIKKKGISWIKSKTQKVYWLVFQKNSDKTRTILYIGKKGINESFSVPGR